MIDRVVTTIRVNTADLLSLKDDELARYMVEELHIPTLGAVTRRQLLNRLVTCSVEYAKGDLG